MELVSYNPNVSVFVKSAADVKNRRAFYSVAYFQIGNADAEALCGLSQAELGYHGLQNLLAQSFFGVFVKVFLVSGFLGE